MKVICVVVTYNGSSWVEQCLASVTSRKHEMALIVVDNASTDRTIEIIPRVPNIEIIQLDKNMGFGAANNIGIRRGLQLGADYVLLLNQDAWISSDTIDILIEHVQENPDCGIVSPLHWNATGLQLDANFQTYICNGSRTFVSDLLNESSKPIYVVPFVNAAIWLVSRQCIERTGGFDPLFFMYAEDEDYCRRVQLHGFRVAIVPSAHAFHSRGTTQQTKTFWQNVLSRSERLKSSLLFDLKDPVHPLIYNLLIHGYRTSCISFALLFHGNLFEILAKWLAFTKAILLISRIQKHRVLSTSGIQQWI